MEELQAFIAAVLADPERRELLLALLEQEGFRADGHAEAREENQ